MGKLVLCFFLYLFSLSALGVIQSIKPDSSKTIVQLASELSKYNSEIQSIRDEINSMEFKLNKGNRRYIQIIQRKKELEKNIFDLKAEVATNRDMLRLEYLKVKDYLVKIVAMDLGGEGTHSEVLTRNFLKEKLKADLQQLNENIEENKRLENRLGELSREYDQFNSTEQELLSLINEMESKKRMSVDQYLLYLDQKDSLQVKLDKTKASILLQDEKDNGLKFYPPLDHFTSMKYRNKGINFKFRGVHPVLSSQRGKVIYSGTLSTYGNVVMIDHGNDTRTVLLGQFLPKVKKDLQVKRGDLLGYTKNLSETGSLYFEVRKKNEAQNTIQLMDKAVLSKKN